MRTKYSASVTLPDIASISDDVEGRRLGTTMFRDFKVGA